MQTREGLRQVCHRARGASVLIVIAAPLLAISLISCGDSGDDRCDYQFTTEEVLSMVPNESNPIIACNQLGETVKTQTPTFAPGTNTPAVSPTPLPPAFNCKNVSYSNCSIAAGTGSGSTTGTASDTKTGLTESACNAQAANAAQSAAQSTASTLAQTEATRVATEIAADPIAEFECGGFSETHDFDFTAGEFTVVFRPLSCTYVFTDVPDAAACTAIQAEFECTASTFNAGAQTCTVRTCARCDGASNITESSCVVTVPLEVDVTNVDVTVTACQICEPPKGEPRCVMTGCLECSM
jgi:hypothetical protein